MTTPTPATADVTQIRWLLSRFASTTAGVTGTVATASDGRLLAMSPSLARPDADQLATICSAFVNLARGVGAGFDLGRPSKVIVDLAGGFLLVSTVNTWCVVGVVATTEADLDEIADDVATFSHQVRDAITPAMVDELAAALARDP